MKIGEWQDWNGVPVSKASRGEMAREILRDRLRGMSTTSVRTGDTLIYFSGYGEDGEGEIIDCVVRRVARVTRTPAEGEAS